MMPTRLLSSRHGDVTFAALLRRLRCGKCKVPPASIYLCAGQREYQHGGQPDWAVQLIPKASPAGPARMQRPAGPPATLAGDD